VLQPYTLVKDLRSDHETSQVMPTLDGDLDEFMHAYLRYKAARMNKKK
jgi:peptide chain release factor 2